MAALLLSSCSQEELGEQGMALPEGEYPLQIGSVSLTAEVSEQPWTRVAESTDGMSSVWKDGDKIGVRIGDNEETGIYVVDVDIEGSVVGVTPEKPVYWKDKQPATITAWYPLDEEIDFTQQDEGLTYLLKGTSTVNADYNTSANLTFSHKLAKVRVVLKGDKANEVQAVTVRSSLRSINDHGTLGSATGGDPIYVPMMEATYNGQRCWEANLRPGWLEPANTFEVAKAEGGPVRVTLDYKVTINAGQVHTITINVEQAPTEIDLDTYEGTTLTVSGKTTIKGNGQQKNLQVTVAPDTELTLQDVNLSYNEGPTIICQGTAHITLSGNNQLSPTSKGADEYHRDLGSGIEVRSSGTLTIESEPDAALTITRKNNSSAMFLLYGAGIGLYENANLVIKGGTITVTGGSPTAEGGANIGGFVSQNAGTITLEGGTFTLQDQCMISDLVGAGSYGTCGTVTIRAGVTINGTTYKEDHIGAIQE